MARMKLQSNMAPPGIEPGSRGSVIWVNEKFSHEGMPSEPPKMALPPHFKTKLTLLSIAHGSQAPIYLLFTIERNDGALSFVDTKITSKLLSKSVDGLKKQIMTSLA